MRAQQSGQLFVAAVARCSLGAMFSCRLDPARRFPAGPGLVKMLNSLLRMLYLLFYRRRTKVLAKNFTLAFEAHKRTQQQQTLALCVFKSRAVASNNNGNY